MSIPTIQRYRGSILGLATGDAVGTTVEFQPPASFQPVTDMIGGGVFQLQPGHWTDDTSMALCLAESLIQCQGFNLVDQLTRYCRWYLADYWRSESLSAEIEQVRLGSFKTKQPSQIVGSGYVVESLEAALWAFEHSDSFEEGTLMAVNLGDDADTTGAIYGQLAGAYYGEIGIPAHWRQQLAFKPQMETMADQLYHLAWSEQ